MGGSLGSGVTALANHLHSLAFDRARGMDGNPTMSILRYTYAGDSLHHAVQGTRSVTAGLTSIACLVRDFTRDLAKALGEEHQTGSKVFEYYPANTAQKLLDGDYIQWNSMRWKPDSISADDSSGVYVVVARREEDV